MPFFNPNPYKQKVFTLFWKSLFMYGLFYALYKKQFTLKGIVNNLKQPLPNCLIKNTSTNEETLSNEKGFFELMVNSGDTLKLSHSSMFENKIIVDENKFINISMLGLGEELNEIELKGKNFVINDTITIDENRSKGYGIQTIEDEEFNSSGYTLGDKLNGKMPGVQMGEEGNSSQTIIRGFSSIVNHNFALYVIDGLPIRRTNGVKLDYKNHFEFLDPNNIKEIKVLKGLAATNKYGSLGNNSVIEITTKTGSYNKNKKSKKVGTTKTYEGKSKPYTNKYTSLFENNFTNDFENNYNVYLQLRKIYGFDPIFFLNASREFIKWNEEVSLKIAMSALDNNDEIDKLDLYSLAFHLDELNHELARQIYNIINDLYPNDIQSLRNIAISNKYFNYIKESEFYFNKLKSKQNLGNLNKTIKIETNPKIIKHRRIVIEWYPFDTEFEFQIINPEKRYYTWKHTIKEENSRISDEKQLGYGLEEFFIPNDHKGNWTFNLRHLNGNELKTPAVKITHFLNYGKKNQIKKTKTIYLVEKNINMNILNISN